MDKPLPHLDDQHSRTADLIGRTIADRVAAEITRSGQYKTSVAKRSDISQATFSRKINAQTDFTIPELVRVADVLDVDWTIFLPAPMPEALTG